MTSNYDVIVIGGGHAGVEACAASSRMGCKTLLITIDLNKIGDFYKTLGVEIVNKDGNIDPLWLKTYLETTKFEKESGGEQQLSFSNPDAIQGLIDFPISSIKSERLTWRNPVNLSINISDTAAPVVK